MSAKPKPAANGKPAAPPPLPDVLTPAQAAAFLQVGEDVVLHEAEGGRLPGRKLGADWRFSRLAITAWLGTPTEPKPKSSKERILALAGVWKDDPTVDAMMADIEARRKSNRVSGG